LPQDPQAAIIPEDARKFLGRQNGISSSSAAKLSFGGKLQGRNVSRHHLYNENGFIGTPVGEMLSIAFKNGMLR
jgi:hypothetical protein